MPLLTLNTGTTYNLKTLLNGTIAGASHTRSQESMCSRLIIKNPSGSPGTAYIARNYGAVDSTHYDIQLTAGDTVSDSFQEEANAIDLGEFSIVVSANSTLLEVYIAPY